MQRLLIAVLTLFVFAAAAAPMTDTDKAAFAGEWRADCAAPRTSAGFTVEFAVTGGEIFIADPGRGRLMLGVRATDTAGGTLSLVLIDDSNWTFQRVDASALVSQSPPKEFPGLKGLTFRHCRPAADRGALKIEPDAIDFLSVMMPPDYPTFIDAHETAGCKARSYGYLSIDLVGPEEFAVTRGTLKPGAKGAPPQLMDSSTWAIDAASELPNVVRLTVTPLSGPNHIRGATTKISLVLGADSNLLTIPEWDAVYRRCAIRDLAPG